MTQLFQYRFAEGGLEGHSFGNLLLTALAAITGSMETAIVEAGRVLAIEGRVLPSTVQDVILTAEVRINDNLVRIVGESSITEAGGKIERVSLQPSNARAYPDAVRALLTADVIVLGPGSLFTSILPNLLVDSIPEAIRASTALKIYVCNIATQKGETDGFNAADHILALEKHVGRGLFDVVLVNNTFPTLNAGVNTIYVPTPVPDDEVRNRYKIIETDLTDEERPWRHSSDKLTRVILSAYAQHKATDSVSTRLHAVGQSLKVV